MQLCNIFLIHIRSEISSQIRLCAAKGVLRIAAREDFAKWIPPLDIPKLALVVQVNFL